VDSWINTIDKNILLKDRKYSQSYQDALIDLVFENIKKSKNPFCVEFGYNCSHLSKKNKGNCTKLIIDHNWSFVLFDNLHENKLINLHKHFLTSDNIYKIFKKYNVPLNVDYISIDVNSSDLWLFEALLKNYKAKLFSVEHNCNYPIDRAITQKEDYSFYENDRLYGASLKALNLVAESYGYTLIWVVEELDAFFIRNDLIEKDLRLFKPNLNKWKSNTNTICHPPVKNKEKLNNCLDYEVYLKSNRNLEKSIKSAKDICETVLLDNKFREYKQFLIRQIKNPKLAFKKAIKRFHDLNKSF